MRRSHDGFEDAVLAFHEMVIAQHGGQLGRNRVSESALARRATCSSGPELDDGSQCELIGIAESSNCRRQRALAEPCCAWRSMRRRLVAAEAETAACARDMVEEHR